MSGPSGNQPDDQAEVVCPNNTYATGCSSYTYYGQMDGAYSTLQSCVAQTAGRQGTFSYAACCNAPNLTCKVKVSGESDLKKGSNSSITCDANWTMLGCSVYTEDANTAGAFIRDGGSSDTCYAVNGQDKFPGEMGVKAYATCCKI